ncbi:MAG: 3-hydroxyacyl-CoA dehydrogenase NAD-binding domain-containing protein [Alphaproteobacteria bacterium]|nr:3-hydroxyacyl-CoA dehydrogenase NAD-binding domain-containing protein [Alphaproteobacteria bacterium]
MMRAVKTLGLIGGGVIGGAWGARAMIHGLDVVLFDPAPDAEKKFNEILSNAQLAWQKLTMAPLPPLGKFRRVASLSELAAVSDWVQESAPENPDLKRKIMTELTAVLPADVGIGSSTSGILPSLFQQGATHPERILVAHPFNPVYLLPLLEICPGDKTSRAWLARARDFYQTLGFQPLMMDREVEGFIADRLMESLWREALHMINENEATAEQIDDAVRFGCGIRWAFMGTFLTYRLAGGEQGMRHFMAQFGPALKWDWSRMTAPELSDSLLDKIVNQSDQQAGPDWDLRAMEQKRDECIIGIMQALRGADIASGKTLARHEERLYQLSHRQVVKHDESKPMPLYGGHVLPKWVDYNNHMTEFAYLENFGNATDAVLRHIGLDGAYLNGGHSFFTVESHICHIGQLRVNERFHIMTQLLGGGDKKLHLFHTMYKLPANSNDGDLSLIDINGQLAPKGGTVVATAEHFCLHVNHHDEKSCSALEPILSNLRRLIAAQKHLAAPERAGRKIGLS